MVLVIIQAPHEEPIRGLRNSRASVYGYLYHRYASTAGDADRQRSNVKRQHRSLNIKLATLSLSARYHLHSITLPLEDPCLIAAADMCADVGSWGPIVFAQCRVGSGLNLYKPIPYGPIELYLYTS